MSVLPSDARGIRSGIARPYLRASLSDQEWDIQQLFRAHIAIPEQGRKCCMHAPRGKRAKTAAKKNIVHEDHGARSGHVRFPSLFFDNLPPSVVLINSEKVHLLIEVLVPPGFDSPSDHSKMCGLWRVHSARDRMGRHTTYPDSPCMVPLMATMTPASLASWITAALSRARWPRKTR